MEINYRRFYRRVKHHYPFIERAMNKPGQLRTLADIPDLYLQFKQLTAATDNDIHHNVNNARLIFIAVITQMEDPLFFTDNALVRRGLRKKLSEVLSCEQTIISHSLRTVKDYLSVYPNFRDKVDYFYGKMTEE